MTEAAAVADRIGRGAAIRGWFMCWRGLLVVEVIWLLFAANFNVGFLWGGDAQTPYAFLRRMFGSAEHAIGYQFGLAIFEAPTYAGGRLLELIGVGTIRTHPSPEVLIAGGATLYVAAALGLVYLVLRRLDLGYAGLAALLALFGSPLFYYGTFSPGQTHAVDAFLAVLAVWLLYLGDERDWPPAVAIGLGVVLGVAPTVRYLEAALGLAVVAMLVAARRWRPAALVALAASVTLGLLLLVPAAMGVHLFGGGGSPEQVLSFSPFSPWNMLVSAKRGLFVWTPVTLLAVAGYVRLLRRGGRRSWFLWTVAAMCGALVVVQVIVPFWDAGWSFSQRYLTAVFPAVAIGLAGLLEWRPRLVTVTALAAVAWSLFLCLTMQAVGFDDRKDTAFSLVRRAGTQTVGGYAYGVWHISHLRVIVSPP